MPSRLLVAVAFLSAASLLQAQTTPPTTPTASNAARQVKSMRAVRASSSITLDGKLDEAAWGAAPASGDFTQSWPKAGEPGTHKSEVRVLYDDAALYVGVRMFDSKP